MEKENENYFIDATKTTKESSLLFLLFPGWKIRNMKRNQKVYSDGANERENGLG